MKNLMNTLTFVSVALMNPVMAAPVRPQAPVQVAPGITRATGAPFELKSVVLKPVQPLINDLIIGAEFQVCTSGGSAELQAVQLTHPTPNFDSFGRPKGMNPGVLELVVVDDFGLPLKYCHAFTVDDETMTFRLNAKGFNSHEYQLSPKFPADYDVFLNGSKIGVLSGTINGIFTFEKQGL